MTVYNGTNECLTTSIVITNHAARAKGAIAARPFLVVVLSIEFGHTTASSFLFLAQLLLNCCQFISFILLIIHVLLLMKQSVSRSRTVNTFYARIIFAVVHFRPWE